MPDTMVMLQVEHRSYWRILDLLDRLVDELEAGREVDAARIELIFRYFTEYPDRCHHPKEDLVFRCLEKKDPRIATNVGDLLGDHAGLTDLTRRARELVADCRAEGTLSSPGCVSSMREFSTAYREHIHSEERHFIPTALESLTRSDLELIDFSMFDARDPIFDDGAEAEFLQLRREILEPTDPADEDTAA